MTLFRASLLMLLAWGALAFGAEYAWAYTPLLVMCVVVGMLGIRAARGTTFPSRALLFGLAAVLLAGVLQTLPIAPTIRDLTTAPAPAVDFQTLYASVTMVPRASDAHASISIAPGRTSLGLVFLASLTVLFAGCTRAISAFGPPSIVRGIVVLGVVVAFVGIFQAATQSEAVYGFWRQPKPDIPFAPFVNENHFAGWMVMAVSVAIGLFAACIAPTIRAASGWRERLLWLASARASELTLSALAIAVMVLSIVVAVSRGGLVGLATAALLSLWWVVRRQPQGARRFFSATCLALILAGAAAWGGVGQTLAEFRGISPTLGGRGAVWRDAGRIIRDHPLTGTGLNTFGIAMLHYQSDSRREMFIEAHNDYLQLAAEGGLLFGIPTLLALAAFVVEIRRRFQETADDVTTYWLRAGAVTGLVAIAVMEVFDFTLQMPGAAVLFVVLAAIAIHRPDYLGRRSEGAPRTANGASY